MCIWTALCSFREDVWSEGSDCRMALLRSEACTWAVPYFSGTCKHVGQNGLQTELALDASFFHSHSSCTGHLDHHTGVDAAQFVALTTAPAPGNAAQNSRCRGSRNMSCCGLAPPYSYRIMPGNACTSCWKVNATYLSHFSGSSPVDTQKEFYGHIAAKLRKRDHTTGDTR
ncbi:hypothetical protein K458DRAFT_485288 [Lentithecium fluviatile CBS 122367]|uniref:Uncharacterized protein n=1 Tax=Lentithecium fluviatile CBS 122367 TaxID=1168545 RepID=A0A6G1JDG3_9PLEO|nr:hypothetical protein K458DRAFT_485288 [Lentithecium fluviatile CBS 122367]